jgi:hypothetical protein
MAVLYDKNQRTAWYKLSVADRLAKAAVATSPGVTFTCRLSNDVIGCAKIASKTVTTYLSNRLADCLRAEGLVVPWLWFVIEMDGDDLSGMHTHGGAAIPGLPEMPKNRKPAFKRALCRLAGEFGGPADQFKVRVGEFDPQERYAGRSGAAGWAAYATKTYVTGKGLARAKGRLGCSPLYVSNPLRRHAREMHEHMRETVGRRPAPRMPRNSPAKGPGSPARRFPGVGAPPPPG